MAVRPRRKSRLVLWMSVLAIMAAIVATALLANDKKNLREIIRRYKIDWIKLAPPEQPKTTILARRGRRLKPTAMTIPDRLPLHAFDDFSLQPASFIRRWNVTGEQLCGALAEAGIDVSAWQQGKLYSSTYECSAQVSGGEDGSSEPASLFLLIRGTPTGAVSSVRMKVILPDTDDGRIVGKKFLSATEILFRKSSWTEFNDAFQAIEKLQNVSMSAFGARLSFAHEYSDPRRFNLIMDLSPASPGQKVASRYFDRSKWLSAMSDSAN